MKNYKLWFTQKSKLEELGHETLSFHEREIWWCSIGLNLGNEQDGKNNNFERPVLILRKFNKKLCWVLPLTSKIKSGEYYYTIYYKNTASTLILSQLRLISSKRLLRHIRKISPYQFKIIINKVKELLPS